MPMQAILPRSGARNVWRSGWLDGEIEVDADEGLSFLLDALARRPLPAGPQMRLNVRLWHGHDSPLQLAPPEWRAAERWAAREPLRVRGLDGSRRSFDPFFGTVTSYRPAEGSADVWYQGSSDLPGWTRAAPALHLFNWMALDGGAVAIHAAAVSFAGRAALLIGPGGSGKSTFAIEAAGRGHGFIGDDYVLLGPGRPPRVEALFRSAKLHAPSGSTPLRRRFTSAGAMQPGDEKAVLLAADDVLVPFAPLQVVLAPVVAGGDVPRLHPISAAQAVRVAAPSTLSQIPGSEPEKLALLARLLAARPCFRLELARDHRRNIEAVAELVERQ